MRFLSWRVALPRASRGPGHPSSPTAPSSGDDCCPWARPEPPLRNTQSTTPRLPKVIVMCSLSSLSSGCSEVPSRGWGSCWGCLLKEAMGMGRGMRSTGSSRRGHKCSHKWWSGLFCFPDPLLATLTSSTPSLRPPASGSVTACALGWGKAPWTSPHLPVSGL